MQKRKFIFLIQVLYLQSVCKYLHFLILVIYDNFGINASFLKICIYQPSGNLQSTASPPSFHCDIASMWMII